MSATLSYRIARVVYEQTGAETLHVVEALTSMIKNLSEKTGVEISKIISDKTIFSDENKILNSREAINSATKAVLQSLGYVSQNSETSEEVK